MASICKTERAYGNPHNYQQSLWKAFAIVAVCVFLFHIACSSKRTRETELQTTLTNIRSMINDYAVHHGHAPRSWDDLISAGYLREKPIDAITGRNDTWRLIIAKDPRDPNGPQVIVDVHSGSEAISSKGTPYASW